MLKGYWISLYYKIDSQKNLQKYANYVTPIIKKWSFKKIFRNCFLFGHKPNNN